MPRNTELKKSSQRTLLPSVLDRLIDLEPNNRNEAPNARSQSLKELKDSVRRDLEWLLNSVRTPHEPPPAARALWKSVYCYGLPDTTGLALKSNEERTRLARVVEVAISDFEPRLMNVVVTIPPASPISRVVHFHIDALLKMEPAPERVFFDTTLELITGQYDVGGDARAR
jgi:type VI secretion system protein ImpF